MTQCPFNPLVSREGFKNGTPHAEIARLRATQRIVWESNDSIAGGHWLVLHRDDIDAVLRDPARFSSSFGPQLDDMPEAMLPMLQLGISFMDPPEHRSKRALVDHAFRPQALEARKEMMQKKVSEIIDSMIDKGHCEFVQDIAMHLPVYVTFKLLGVHESDYARMFGWLDTIRLASDPDSGHTIEEAYGAFLEISVYAAQLAADHRNNPSDSLTTTLLDTPIDGHRITDEEYATLFISILIGGVETTRNVLSWLFYELIQHPDQLRMVQNNFDLIPNVIEETLRFHSPVAFMRRTAMAAGEFAGEQIKRGDKLLCMFASVNRDPAHFENPDRFDITRDPVNTRRTMRSFGFGVHTCLGQHQARLNLAMMTREILSRMTDFKLPVEPTYIYSAFGDGMQKMPFAFTRRG